MEGLEQKTTHFDQEKPDSHSVTLGQLPYDLDCWKHFQLALGLHGTKTEPGEEDDTLHGVACFSSACRNSTEVF